MSGYAKWALNHMLPAEKKYSKECEEARQDSFKLILKFLDEWGNRSCRIRIGDETEKYCSTIEKRVSVC